MTPEEWEQWRRHKQEPLQQAYGKLYHAADVALDSGFNPRADVVPPYMNELREFEALAADAERNDFDVKYDGRAGICYLSRRGDPPPTFDSPSSRRERRGAWRRQS